MTGFPAVTLLYTANLRGDLHLLPRLFTLIQTQKQTANGPVFLLDVGDTCALDSWVCQATQGRAPFLVLDSMGYDAAIIGGPEQVPIPPSSLRRLAADMIMPVVIWDRSKTVQKKGVSFTLAPGNATVAENGPVLGADRSSETLPEPGETVPVLGDVAPGCVARIELSWPEWRVIAAEVVSLDDTTPADPTVTAVVELVEAEARLYTHGQGKTQ